MNERASKKQRAALLLVERGLVESRERARALILAGVVYLGERRIEKAGEALAPDAPLTLRANPNPFVSRGGLKLQGALEAFGLSVEGLVAADFGASTGGFSDCLLQRGALRVYAIDVGYGQLHSRLRDDPRVVVMERCNARHLKEEDLPEKVDLVVIDASFIGLEKLLPAVKAVLKAGGRTVALVKPQFQVGRRQVGKGGVVRDDALRYRAVQQVLEAAAALGFHDEGQADCVLPGPQGNREIFLNLRLGAAVSS